MSRRPDWISRVNDVFVGRAALPFVWGSNDCILFPADCVLAATDIDPAADFRGAYHGARRAKRIVQALGGLEALAARHCGEEVAPGLAQYGDVGLLVNGGHPCLAVFGGEFFHAPGETGLLLLPVEACSKAWRMPD